MHRQTTSSNDSAHNRNRPRRNLVLALALTVASAFAGAGVARAEAMAKSSADLGAVIQATRDKAAAFRKEAEEHRAIAKDYRTGEMAFDVTGHVKPMALRVAKQHEKMAADADKMAMDADALVADYEKLGKELDKKK